MIAITRGENTSYEFVKLVKSIGLDVIPLQLIKLSPNEEIKRLKYMLNNPYDYILFMSPNAIDMLDDQTIYMLKGKKIVAVGPKTKTKLEEHAINVSFMPEKYSSYGIIELFKSMDVKGKSILIPRSVAANNYLKEELIKLGMIVHEIRFYDAKPTKDDRFDEFISLLRKGLIKCIVFTSASNVHAFFYINPDLIDMLNNVHVIAIGPFTNDALKAYNVSAIVAEEHTIEGIFKEIKKILKCGI